MSARIKWIFVRKMILKQDTHCQCVIACAAVASCRSILSLFFWHMLNEPRNFQRVFSSLRLQFFLFVCIFFCFVSQSRSFGELHTCNKYTSRNIFFILFYRVMYATMMCAIRVNGTAGTQIESSDFVRSAKVSNNF